MRAKAKWEVDWRWITILSAIAAAVYKANDSFITHRFFNDPSNETVVAFTYLIIGGWVGLFSNIVFSKFFGNKLDSRFTWFEWGSARIQVFAFGAGLLSAISTFFMLWGSSLYDPSRVIPLGSLTIIFLVIYDSYRREIALSEIFWPMILAVAGSILVSFSWEGTNFLPQITFKAIGLLLILRGIFAATATVFSKVGVGERGNPGSTNAVNFAFWRFLWLVVTGTIFALTMLIWMGKLPVFVSFLQNQFWSALPFILLTMFFVFLGNTLETSAYTLQEGKVSRVSVLLNTQLILGIPLTLLGAQISPLAFGILPSDIFSWIFRAVGALLIFWGASELCRRHDRT